jgi:putative glycosyl hydrolase-like family 15 (GHL15) protein
MISHYFDWPARCIIAILILFLTSCNSVYSTPTPASTIFPSIISTNTNTPVTATSTSTVSITNRFAWFYKPPSDNADLLMIAHQFQFFILSRGDEDDRNQLIALGAQRPILQYVRFDAIQDPHDCEARPRQNQVAFNAGDFCQISMIHPDWFLLNRDGQRIVRPYGDQDYVMMDPGNPGWRQFFLERIELSQVDPNWDGVFLDNVEVTFSFRENSGQFPRAYPDEQSYQNAIQGFLQYLRNEYFHSNSRLLFANIVARKDEADFTKYLTWLDGAMHEGWAVDWPNRYRDPEIWEEQMQLAEQTQAMKRFIILVSQGTQSDTNLQQFAFASYLLINQGKAAFRYAASGQYNEAWLYSNYQLDLGTPIGQRYKSGDTWYRLYTNGMVAVNPVTHESEIKIAP